MFHLSFIRDRLAEHRHERHPPGSQTREAAVAVILRELQPRHPEILFIQRAEKEGDPDGGKMAMSSGKIAFVEPVWVDQGGGWRKFWGAFVVIDHNHIHALFACHGQRFMRHCAAIDSYDQA